MTSQKLSWNYFWAPYFLQGFLYIVPYRNFCRLGASERINFWRRNVIFTSRKLKANLIISSIIALGKMVRWGHFGKLCYCLAAFGSLGSGTEKQPREKVSEKQPREKVFGRDIPRTSGRISGWTSRPENCHPIAQSTGKSSFLRGRP